MVAALFLVYLALLDMFTFLGEQDSFGGGFGVYIYHGVGSSLRVLCFCV